jgi:hypothetical protein
MVRSSEDLSRESLAIPLRDIARRSIHYRQTMALGLIETWFHPVKTRNGFSQITSNCLSARFFGWLNDVSSCLAPCCKPLVAHGITLIRSQLDPDHILYYTKEREDVSLAGL